MVFDLHPYTKSIKDIIIARRQSTEKHHDWIEQMMSDSAAAAPGTPRAVVDETVCAVLSAMTVGLIHTETARDKTHGIYSWSRTQYDPFTSEEVALIVHDRLVKRVGYLNKFYS